MVSFARCPKGNGKNHNKQNISKSINLITLFASFSSFFVGWLEGSHVGSFVTDVYIALELFSIQAEFFVT